MEKQIFEQIKSYLKKESEDIVLGQKPEIPNFLANRINLLRNKYKDNESEIENYINKVIIPQILLYSGNKDDDNNQINTENTQNNQKDNQNEFNIDEDLKKLRENNKDDGIDTSDESFKEIKDKYEKFFRERCKNIVENSKEKKADIELREFMIRHNRFVPLFNLRHISPELLEQMAERFSRMKKDPEDIQKEYDKIELTTTEIK